MLEHEAAWIMLPLKDERWSCLIVGATGFLHADVDLLRRKYRPSLPQLYTISADLTRKI